MKKYEDFSGSIDTIIEEYSNFNEFCSIQDSRTPTPWAVDHGQAREAYDSYWRRCESFGQAQDFLLHGFDEDVKEMVGRVKTLQKQGTRMRTRRYADVTGFQPIVQNAILGLPNSMMNSKKTPVNNKVVTIMYNPSVSASTDKGTVMKFGSELLSHIMNLEKNGFRVKLEYACPFLNGKHLYVLRIPIKNENNPLNIKRVSFPIAHVGMFRYLAFDWYERLPKSEYMSRYGDVFTHAPMSVQKKFKSLLNDNEYMIQLGDDLEYIFGSIK